MSRETIIIVGGGYAGLNAVNALHKLLAQSSGEQVRLVLIDKKPYHFRKVMLYKEAVGGAILKVPFTYVLNENIEFIQASITSVDPAKQTIEVSYPQGAI